MKIALIAHGQLPIPTDGYGAVERVIWQHTCQLRSLGHDVDIYNSREIEDVIEQLNLDRYDFVHCHNERFASALNARLRGPYALTTHHGGQYAFSLRRKIRRGNPLLDSLESPANIVLTERLRDLYVRSGYRGFLRVLPNAVAAEQFRVTDRGNGRAICIGRVCARKRQAWLARISRGRVDIDFVGPHSRSEESTLESVGANYLGAWSKPELDERLTEYSCLVLLSESEGAPMVVLEALAAGLSVVVSEACAANLSEEAFITVLPDDEDRPEVIANAIHSAIEGNDALRPAIRSYAECRFDCAQATERYLEIIREFQETSYSQIRPG